MLSKSRYLKGLKCTKALWLNHYKKEVAFYPEHVQQIFATGNTAGELAQQYFPNGELALVSNYPDSKAITRTKELIKNGCKTIYEATFAAENTLVALDILHQINGKWHAFEVKSTNSVKEEHVRDAAIEYYVMLNSGIEIEDISIMHFNREYIKNGEINPKELFTYESVFTRMEKYLPEIPKNIEAFLEVYQQEEPILEIGDHCNKPYGCEFANYCHKLPGNQELLNEISTQPIFGTEITYKNEEGIRQFLNENPFPIYSLDFESAQYGIPKFDNSRPYQQIPFQYSLHYQKDANSEPEHFEFLGNGIDDPREVLIQQMIKDLDPHSTNEKILMYSSFEKTMLTNFIRDFPKYKEALENIKERFIDLGVIFRTYIKTEATQKTWSLKVVLPTFLPHLSYQDLEIQHGMATVEVYKGFANLSTTEQEEARKNMLAYCELDTLAVLELYNLLFKV
jgi:hypothetical protein